MASCDYVNEILEVVEGDLAGFLSTRDYLSQYCRRVNVCADLITGALGDKDISKFNCMLVSWICVMDFD